jgi:biopolymer transport protein ExbB/TolQ
VKLSPELWATIIAALAAIIASVLTSFLTHWLWRRRHRKEYELRWLEERFQPALNFLGRVLAIISNAPSTPEGRRQIVDEIHNIVIGPSKENNAWCIAVLLDPEDTGLREHIQSAMTYAHIAEDQQELIRYQSRLHLSFEEVAEEFRRERYAIVTGTSLWSLIKRRKIQLDRASQRLSKVLETLRAFSEDKESLKPTLRRVKRAGIRGATLGWAIRLTAGEDAEKQEKLDQVRKECRNRNWLSEMHESGV